MQNVQETLANQPEKEEPQQENEQLIRGKTKQANKHVLECSNSLVIWKILNKTALKLHFISVRLVKTRKMDDANGWLGLGMQDPAGFTGKSGVHFLESNWAFLSEIKNIHTIYYNIYPWLYVPKEFHAGSHRQG